MKCTINRLFVSMLFMSIVLIQNGSAKEKETAASATLPLSEILRLHKEIDRIKEPIPNDKELIPGI